MDAYILKMVFSSAILIGFYYLVLEQLKAHGFKRFYLLCAILFSLLIPFVSIPYGSAAVSEPLVTVGSATDSLPEPQVVSVFSLKNIAVAVYLSVALLLLSRFLISLNALRKDYLSGIKIRQADYTLVLKSEKTVPYSFLNWIFLNKDDYETQKIDRQILLHEQAHTRQRHSLDVLLIETLLILFWFNPAFYFFKKAIITNHEYLADEAVLQNNKDIPAYQRLLLGELSVRNRRFAQQFNYITTIKRIKMMTKKSDLKSKTLPWVSLPLAAALFFLLAEKIPAKQKAYKQPDTIVHMEKSLPAESKTSMLERDTIKPSKVTATDPAKNSDKAVLAAAERALENKRSDPQTGNPTDPTPREASQKPEVDKIPEYPGGFNVFRSAVGSNFDTKNVNAPQKLLKATAFFVITEEGNVENVTGEGDNEIFTNELIKAVKASATKEKWKPAEKDGKPVRYVFKLPVTMSFE